MPRGFCANLPRRRLLLRTIQDELEADAELRLDVLAVLEIFRRIVLEDVPLLVRV